MATADATMFPVKGQAFRLGGQIRSSSTGNVVTGGLTDLDFEVSKDGAAFANAAGSITEITASGGGGSGYFVLDFTAADMTANLVAVRVTATNANAVEFSVFITPADLTYSADHWMTHTVKKLEQGWMQVMAYLRNTVFRENAANSTITVLQDDESTPYYTMRTTNDGTTETRHQD